MPSVEHRVCPSDRGSPCTLGRLCRGIRWVPKSANPFASESQLEQENGKLAASPTDCRVRPDSKNLRFFRQSRVVANARQPAAHATLRGRPIHLPNDCQHQHRKRQQRTYRDHRRAGGLLGRAPQFAGDEQADAATNGRLHDCQQTGLKRIGGLRHALSIWNAKGKKKLESLRRGCAYRAAFTMSERALPAARGPGPTASRFRLPNPCRPIPSTS
jgi:hypothetical protein